VNNTLAVSLFDFLQLLTGSIFRLNQNDAFIVAKAFEVQD
jgi:hypothetical protein